MIHLNKLSSLERRALEVIPTAQNIYQSWLSVVDRISFTRNAVIGHEASELPSTLSEIVGTSRDNAAGDPAVVSSVEPASTEPCVADDDRSSGKRNNDGDFANHGHSSVQLLLCVGCEKLAEQPC